MIKKLFPVFFILFSFGLNAQSLYNTSATGWVNIGDLDVAGDQLTVEAIITMTGPSVNIVSKHTNPADVNYLFRPGSFEISTTSGFANFSGIASSGVTLNLNECYHLAATYDGQNLSYYVNGCLTGTMPWTGNMVQNNLITAIGNQSSCQCEAFNGYIDEVRIWNVARTQAQIQANMNTLPTPTTQPGLLAYYKFDGNYLNLQGNPTFDGTVLNGATLQNNLSCSNPTVLSTSVSGTDAYCFGTNSGLIQVNATGGYTPYTYSIDGINYQSSSLFPNVPAGNYTVYTASNPNCIVTQNISITEPTEIILNTSTQDISCYGQNNGSASVTAQGGTPGYSYEWNTTPPQSTAMASNLPAGTYQVTVTDNSCQPSAIELVVNGDFSQGNTGFTSSYINCNTPNCLGEGMYAVGTDASSYHNSFIGVDHTTGTGNFMIINGSSSINDIWCQTINVTPNTDYNFSCWVATCVPVNLAELQFSINGVMVGNIFNAPSNVNQWDQFYSSWNSGSNTSATICITNLNLQLSGNDFAIDDISFTSCTKSCFKTETITLNEPPPLTLTLTASQNPICSGDTIIVTTAVSGGTTPYDYQWNNGSTSASISLIPLVTFECGLEVFDSNYCSIIDSVEIIVNPLPVVNLGGDTALCQGSTLVLDAGPGFANYSWSTNESSQTIIADTQGTYWVSVTDGNGCQNSDTMFLTVNPLPPLSLGLDTQVCAGSIVVLDAGPGMSSYLWNSGDATQTLNVTTTGNYAVTITNANSCQSSDTVLVIVHSNPNLSLPPTASACDGQPLTIDAGPGFSSYNWNSGELTQTISPTVSGNYVVTVSNINGCQAQDSTYVTFYALPAPDLGPDPTICADSTVVLNPGIFDSYLWSNGVTTPTLSINNSWTYSVTVTDNNGCQETDYIIVFVNPLPQINLGADQIMCDGNQAILDAGTGFSAYSWSTGEITQTINISTSGLYTAEITDNNGCKNSDQVQVTVNPNPVANLGSDTAICYYSPFVLNPGNATVYQWQDGSSSPTYSVSQSGSYSVTLTNIYNCISTDQVNIIIYPLPVVNFNSLNAQGCPPLSTSLSDFSSITSGNNINWEWDFGDGSTAIGETTVHEYTLPGYYDIGLTVTSAQGCSATTVLNNHILVHTEPTANFIVTPEEASIFEPLFRFYDQSVDAYQFQWNFGDSGFSQEANPYHTYTDSGYYETMLIVYNSYGCSDTAYKEIRVNPEFVIYFPNAFTPNGKGLNEVFLGYGEGISEYDLRIFNRWGAEIFHSSNINIGWDGKFAGLDSPQGVYIYLCSGKRFNGIPFRTEGHVTLIR
ncbi:MAG: PKD domain-containing protein [Bacteroidota bacterium]|nr:PKD domain-containing protein [Bacteroidota bacterium]